MNLNIAPSQLMVILLYDGEHYNIHINKIVKPKPCTLHNQIKFEIHIRTISSHAL